MEGKKMLRSVTNANYSSLIAMVGGKNDALSY